MRRLLRLLLPAIVLVPAIAIGMPASATPPDTPTCGGQYSFALSAPMGAPGTASATTSFSMTMTNGTCAGSQPWMAPNQFYGSLTGNCGAATGSGYLLNGHWFTIAWAGNAITLADAAAGAFAVTSLDCSRTQFDTIGAVGSIPIPQACYGIGTLSLSSPFSALTTTSTGFGLSLGAFGICSNLWSLFQAVGTVTGNCEFAAGSGVTNDGATFDLLWIQNRLVFTGNVIGVVSVAPDVISGQSCVSGARNFLANGAGVKLL